MVGIYVAVVVGVDVVVVVGVDVFSINVMSQVDANNVCYKMYYEGSSTFY